MNEQSDIRKHFFTKKQLRWGWNILMFNRTGSRTAQASFIGKGIKDDDQILLEYKDETVYEFTASEVKYETNPSDMFSCKLTFTGTTYQKA